MSKLTGAYAVDALTGPERAEFEHHLADCEECAQEVRELRETAARLGAAAATEPPEDLKHRVLREIAHTRQEPPGAEPPAHHGARAGRTPNRWAMRLAVAASVVGIALAATFGGFALHTQRQLEQAQQSVEQTGDRSAEIARVLHASDARIVRTTTGGGDATMVVSSELGKAVFMSERMPRVPSDRVHQLWAIGPAGARSMGLLQQDPRGRAQPVVTDLPANTDQVGITNEPEGGSQQPSTDPIMLLHL